MYLYYFVFFVVLFCVELIYLKLADRYAIIDRPNERSSHTLPTIRGGGIIFIISVLGYSILNQFAFPFLILTLLIVGIVSFIDDVKGVSRRNRFLAHVLAILFLLIESNQISLGWALIPIGIILIGIVNAYNFMDGINGITGFYSLSILIPFWYYEQEPVFRDFIGVVILSVIVFLFFNARVKARCFAGDIGSVGMAIIVLFIILNKITKTDNWIYIFTLLVYGIDSIFTIAQRLFQGENIFNAHRKHLYQFLANEYKFSHLQISLSYAFLQLAISFWLFIVQPSIIIVLLVAVTLSFLYAILKYKLTQNIEAKSNK